MEGRYRIKVSWSGMIRTEDGDASLVEVQQSSLKSPSQRKRVSVRGWTPFMGHSFGVEGAGKTPQGTLD